MDDGIALTSIAHPVAPWYRRLWLWLFHRPRLSPDSLETVEININPPWMHAGAPPGMKCADCAIDGHACPYCYTAWWHKRHPNVMR